MSHANMGNETEALQYMFSVFPNSKIQSGKDRYLSTCPKCGKPKLWWYANMPHHGGCFACGYSFKSVFDLGFRTQFDPGHKEDLSLIDNLVLRYRTSSGKKHRLSERVIAEFNLFVGLLRKKSGDGTYNNICFPFENDKGYLKHLNFSGKWISIDGKFRNKEAWLNDSRIKGGSDTIYVLGGEWDLFAFWENTGVHGISPVDGEGGAAKMSKADLSIFSNKNVAILYDNDLAGRSGASALARRIQKFHKTKSLKVVDLSRLGLSGGEDIDDFFSSGGESARLFQEIESTAEFSPASVDESTGDLVSKSKYGMPENIYSVLESDILSKIWDSLLLPEARRSIVFESIANYRGIFREKSPGQFRAELKTYEQELNTMRFLAFDMIVADKIKSYHIKKAKKTSQLESDRFFYFDGKCYRFVDDSVRNTIADDIARSITSPDARISLSKARKQALEDMAIAMIECDPVEFDADTRYVNFQNGVYDLSTRSLVPHSPDFLVTHILSIDYTDSPECPNFIEAISMWTGSVSDADEMVKSLYYLISGNRSHEIVLWLYGTGDDGKTVFSHLCRSLIGDERTSAIAVEDMDGRHTTAHLFGKLLNISDEVPEKFIIPDAIFKRVSGNSLITADPKNRDHFTFRSRALWIIPSNNLPRSNDTTHGYHRRFKILKFRKIPAEKKDRSFFEKKLLPELSEIASFLLVEGRRIFDSRGFIETETEHGLLETIKEKNPVFSYWMYVSRCADDLTQGEYDRYISIAIDSGLDSEDAMRYAEKNMASFIIHSGSLDDISSDVIFQSYRHKTKGDIIIVNTNRHYEMYREHFRGDEVRLVAQSTFRSSTIDFIVDRFRGIFSEVRPITVWKNDAISGKRKNVQVIEVVKNDKKV